MMNLAVENDIPERPHPRLQNRFQGIVGRSRPILDVFRLVEKIADSDSTIFINGESGTGKGLIARAIHDSSSRRKHPFVSVNCSAIPESLMESELFGHVRGAFTGANADRVGRFEQANKGTLFLDEVGDMSPDLQVKILKALEEREVEPLGGCRKVKVDVRIITATHKDMKREVEKGTFREDLYYRLYVIPVKMPALRECREDIPLLVDHFLAHFNTKNNRCVEGITEKALEVLKSYSWPGNIRELKNMMERLVVLEGKGCITRRNLPCELTQCSMPRMPHDVDISDEGICLHTAVTEFEKALILKSLEKTQWVKKQAADLLQLKRTTLVEKIKRYNLH
jgi:transcriptional regulator with GAF, ATPase, and Fis domain